MKRTFISLVLAFLVACQPVTPIAIEEKTKTPLPASIPTTLLTTTPTSIPSFDTTIPYKLRQPKADELTGMIDSLLAKEQDNSFLLSSSFSTDALGIGSLHRLIGNDLINYYADGFPNAETFVTQTVSPWKIFLLDDQKSISPVLRIGLLQYINSNQGSLENNEIFSLPRAELRTFSMDLDGDGKLEWLIGAEYPEYSLQNWLLIKKQPDGLYHFMDGGPYFNLSGIQDFITDIEIQDLTGDGNPEIVQVVRYYIAGSVHGIISVYTWDGGQPHKYETIYMPTVPPVYGETSESEYSVDDFDQNGKMEIRVNTPRFRIFDCQWIESSYYYFTRHDMVTETINNEIPQTNECLIARAVESKAPDEKIGLYQRALEYIRHTETTNDKQAWVQLQFAMAYAAQGNDNAAITQLENIYSTNGEGAFLEFLKEIPENTIKTPLSYCDSLYVATSNLWGKRIGSDIDNELAIDGYPMDFSPNPFLVCPISDILNARLNGIKIPITESPMEAFAKQGIPFAWSKSINWDNDPLQEQVGVLKFSKTMIILLDGEAVWQPRVIENYSLNSANIDAGVYFSPNQTSPELLVFFTTGVGVCDTPDTEKSLVTINLNTLKYSTRIKCDSNSYSLSSDKDIEFTINQFNKTESVDSDNKPDWYYLTDKEDVDEYQNDIMDFVWAVEDLIVSQEDSNKAHSKLNTIVAALPQGDPSTNLLLSRLYYLRGLNYELSGQSDLAVKTYLELIKFSPDSLWSQYAKLRLKPVQQ
jgi:tetratricopeptide (TPR) repeat protein